MMIYFFFGKCKLFNPKAGMNISTETLLMLVLLSLNSVYCLANDTVGAIALGGVEYKKTEGISMEKESLTISVDKVRVEYEFLNTTDKPIQETILFPMPLFGFDYGCSPEYSGGLQQFKVWINGEPIIPAKTIIAKLPDGADVTSRLKEAGLNDNDIAEYRGVESACGDMQISGNFAVNLQKLREEKLVDQVVDEHPTPLWMVGHIYHWQATFPPKRLTRVVHEYRPFTGAVAMGYEFTTDKTADLFSKYEYSVRVSGDESYCMADGAVRLAMQIQRGTNKPFVARTVQYVLTTGANWAGPIKDFSLNLKKRATDEIVTLCFDGEFKKTGDLTLTAHKINFLPTKELDVKFYFPDDSRYGFPNDPGPVQHY